jgi:hypothetical protein
MEAKIFICGDIVNTKVSDSFIDTKLEKIIKEQDFAICNFEAPIEGESIFQKAGPNISQKKETIEILKKSGFDLLLLANNHMYDYGALGLEKTISIAKEHNLEVIGAGDSYSKAYSPLIKKINGLKIGFVNASEAQFGVLDGGNLSQTSGYAWINHPLIDETIIKLKETVDKVIVCAHAGLENYSIPLVQWKERYRTLCDLGADCIIASHPHIPQGFELYKKKPIFYSLGNFYFDSLHFSKLPDYSFSVILKINKKEILFDLIYHYKKDGKVVMSNENDVPFNIQVLNDQIENVYEIEKMYIHAYHNITKKMFSSIYSSYLPNDTLVEFIKKTIRKCSYSKKIKVRREFLLQHLNRNETYQWVTVTAIELLNRKK